MVVKTKLNNSSLKDWIVIDAKQKNVGRLASEIAVVLMGKNKADYNKNLDSGDYVIVINASEVQISGNKNSQKKYYHHSGFHGGLREQSFDDLMALYPDRVILSAVKGMLPKNKLGRKILKKLKVYSGGEHPHSAQVS
ncbi:MAG: 50S ribosomal protein L13 [SAR202 cluster bacterium]|nr:50S ribosomal protein L13 [SAR202 cluster bacterium]|tara:strand:- start:8146 stop:8559 length:414 start_codon:yes stop_codon:yes gene_type:complete